MGEVMLMKKGGAAAAKLTKGNGLFITEEMLACLGRDVVAMEFCEEDGYLDIYRIFDLLEGLVAQLVKRRKGRDERGILKMAKEVARGFLHPLGVLEKTYFPKGRRRWPGRVGGLAAKGASPFTFEKVQKQASALSIKCWRIFHSAFGGISMKRDVSPAGGGAWPPKLR